MDSETNRVSGQKRLRAILDSTLPLIGHAADAHEKVSKKRKLIEVLQPGIHVPEQEQYRKSILSVPSRTYETIRALCSSGASNIPALHHVFKHSYRRRSERPLSGIANVPPNVPCRTPVLTLLMPHSPHCRISPCYELSVSRHTPRSRLPCRRKHVLKPVGSTKVVRIGCSAAYARRRGESSCREMS